METTKYNIAELAAAAGITSRAVRFYVQQGLLNPPTGLGRGDHYTEEHLRRLLQIQELQRSGYSLAAIKAITHAVDASNLPAAPPAAAAPAPPASSHNFVTHRGVSSELVARVTLLPGVTVEFDVTKHHPSPEGLLTLRELAWEVFNKS